MTSDPFRLITALFRRRNPRAGHHEPRDPGSSTDEIEGARGEFGYAMTNPVPTRGPWGEIEYLSRLRCPCGEPFVFYRPGSCGCSPDGHVADLFELKCRGNQHHLVLFLDMYHPSNSTRAPRDLSLGDPEGVGTTIALDNFRDFIFSQVKEALEKRNT